jgi:hypothetical protein
VTTYTLTVRRVLNVGWDRKVLLCMGNTAVSMVFRTILVYVLIILFSVTDKYPFIETADYEVI